MRFEFARLTNSAPRTSTYTILDSVMSDYLFFGRCGAKNQRRRRIITCIFRIFDFMSSNPLITRCHTFSLFYAAKTGIHRLCQTHRSTEIARKQAGNRKTYYIIYYFILVRQEIAIFVQ